ncbi:MAG: HAMP domain-containing protein [Chloroflexi bacterium]|nr:HAMP domain-containing protein [Chloroflexota bacterium]
MLRSFRHSLRARLALGVTLPIFLALSSLSFVHYWRESLLAQDQARLAAAQLGQLLTGSLRHAMLVNDHDMLATVLKDVGAMNNVERIQVLDLSGQVKADSRASAVGQTREIGGPGCAECHRFAPAVRPRTVLLSAEGDILRIASPIPNEPACAGCHPGQVTHLGMLLADVPMLSLKQHLLQDLQTDLAISAGLTLLMTIGVYLLVHWLVVRRVEAFRQPLARYAGGDFASRLPVNASPTDEIGELASAFNRMADELERHAQEEKERSELRQRAIVEERERIARELHDGLAQLLGYVGTKAGAVRLLLNHHQITAAEKQLVQLEEAARELFVDVREAILGLKMAGRAEAGLPGMLREYTAQFNRLSGLPVELLISPEVEGLPLKAEVEMQLSRIVQEALTNVRKHASASTVRVSVRTDDDALELRVEDDGEGFDPAPIQAHHRPHFGLGTMQERAEAIAAQFSLTSQPGAGTCVTVRLALEENENHARAGR